ncbi:hypothetical protein AMATHDRAFT_1726 [Amanita thiersii Skay4041]|uniref:Uncharacterized protein n=1 Tax=Amanita thiersii Skay4041 TaxID=703135 RepID=A0A2A9NX64_9AGAR|nr:hypothetical protein AMATHDRAFT_1726 [Amanita thiersii Skay4041]
MYALTKLIVAVLAVSPVLGRQRWLERDSKPVFLHPRRFGQEQPPVLQRLRGACPGEVCGVLAGKAVTPLLAAQPECSQQDLADEIIDSSRQFDEETQTNMISIAKEYRQAEKNTPPDFSTNPPALRNSVFCQKAPKNSELDGLVQTQDPANDPNLFFDPATKATVKRGEQPNTFPFGTNNTTNGTVSHPAMPSPTAQVLSSSPEDKKKKKDPCVTTITITVSATNPAAASVTNAVTISFGNDPTPTDGSPPTPTITSPPIPTNIGDFGSCSVPEIEFGVGFDGRKETSFRPVDQTSYNHGSAQNVDIISQFMCDTLTNSCGADQTAKDTCNNARLAADVAAKGTGAQADAFNAVFGKTTQFSTIDVVDEQGQIVPASIVSASTTATTTLPEETSATIPANNETVAGDFGSCSVPQIEFGTGFDRRKETSFQPVDKASYNHGSAQNIDIITGKSCYPHKLTGSDMETQNQEFICDTLTNSCKSDQTAKDTCAKARAAASAAQKGTGAQADAFNAAFGIQTNFASVAVVDDQGQVMSVSAPNPVSTVVKSATAVTTAAAPTSTTRSGSNTGSNSGSSSGSNTSTNSNSSSGTGTRNLQRFTGSLGGVTAPAVTALGEGRFQVAGNAVITDLRNALARSCNVQNNKCADAANASGNNDGFTVAACNEQQKQCLNTAVATAS